MAAIDAAAVAADDIEPAVRAFADGMTAVFLESQGNELLGRSVGLSPALAIPIARQPAVAAEVEIVAVETQAHAAGFRLGENGCLVCFACSLAIVQDFDPSPTGDNDTSFGV